MEEGLGSKLFTGCCVAIIGTVLTLLALLLLAYCSLQPPGPPDVKSVARSAKVNAAGRQAATTLDGLTARLGEGRTWLDRHPSAGMFDRCESLLSGIMQAQRWDPVNCTRSVQIFAGFDGDFVGRGRDLHRALRAQGWFEGSNDVPQILESYRPPTRKGRASPSNLGAASLPAVFYERPRGTLPGGGLLSMILRWEERGFPRSDYPELFQKSSKLRTTTREDRRVEVRPTIEGILRQHRYALFIELNHEYFRAGTIPTPTPTPRPGGYCQCRSGGTCDCPGG